MAIIAGIFNDPFGVPMAGVQLLLTGRKNTSVTFTGTNATAVTAEDGSYSMTVLPGVYAVSAKIGFTPDYLGIIQVYADSPDATLNQYLADFNPDDLTPEVLREMQLLLVEAELAAKSAWLAAEKAKEYALIPRGEFNPATDYQKNDLVEYDGSEYLATDDITGITPPESPWQLFTSRGEQGVQGEPGPKGDTGEQGLQGEVGPKGDTGEQGPQGEVGPKGDIGEQGPQGEVGPKGDTGEQGPQGEAGAKGDTGEQGLQGETGDTGPAGPPNTLEIGSVTTLSPGSNATAEITGDAPNQTLNLGIPQGEQGGIVPRTWHSPGAVIFGMYSVSDGESFHYPGDVLAASRIHAAFIMSTTESSVSKFSIGYSAEVGTVGSWRLQGMTGSRATSNPDITRVNCATCFQRIDLLDNTYEPLLRAGQNVRNPRYSSEDGTTIDCELFFNDRWHPFTASLIDVTWWGRMIFENATAGMYGAVADYQE